MADVGAGLTGLTAARKIRNATRPVVVVEARDRVGGRNFDQPLTVAASSSECQTQRPRS